MGKVKVGKVWEKVWNRVHEDWSLPQWQNRKEFVMNWRQEIIHFKAVLKQREKISRILKSVRFSSPKTTSDVDELHPFCSLQIKMLLPQTSCRPNLIQPLKDETNCRDYSEKKAIEVPWLVVLLRAEVNLTVINQKCSTELECTCQICSPLPCSGCHSAR